MSETDTLSAPQPKALIGTWRRFGPVGPVGPVYEVVGMGERLSDGDRMLRVRVLETGEEVDYRLAECLRDPSET